MAVIRIYTPTFRRPQLLRRALRSLLDQTCADWICEVHNDDPLDEEPARIITAFADSRLSLVTHQANLGPTRTFNVFFKPVSEPYISILEDDNWWEPQFLESLCRVMEAHPGLNCIWSNMRIWQEQHDGSWMDTGTTVWPCGEGLTVFSDPQPRQWNSALHSNGAMLVRSALSDRLVIPDETPFSVVEMVRERRMSFPYAVLHEPLANFSRTLQTSRGGAAEWGAAQFLLASSFLRNLHGDGIDALWNEARATQPPASNTLLLAALDGNRRDIWKRATPGEWLAFLRGILGHPGRLLTILSARRRYPHLWRFLESNAFE